MNPAVQRDRLLDRHAVLVRDTNHLVYRLDNGQTFVAAKTPSDHRAAKNNLSQLRRALGIARGPNPKGEQELMAAQEIALAVAPTASPQEREAESLKLRIESAIVREEAAQERLLAEAQAHERKVHMLKALLPFADDSAAEDALRGVLPNPERQAMPEPPAAPPQVITERVQVTRQLVLAATQTFEDRFTVNDVLALMTGGRDIDSNERQRVRSSIAQCVMSLHERGELIREAEGYGKRQAIWKKAVLNGNGHNSGIGTRA